MSVLKHLKTLQHVSIFSDHLQGARRCLVKVTEFKIVKVICDDALCGEVQHTSPHRAPHTHTHVMLLHHHK